MDDLVTLDQKGLWTWRKYLGNVQWQGGPRSLFFISFEDALLALFRALDLSPGAVIAFPDFYCMDVVRFVERWGFRAVFYRWHPAGAPPEVVRRLFQEERPAAFVHFHAFGVRRALPDSIPVETIIIEDYAHRLLAPEDVTDIPPRRFLIDSLRKVSPFQGSRLFGAVAASGTFWSLYRFRLLTLFLAFRAALGAARVTGWGRLFALAEALFERHNALVGNMSAPARGFMMDRFLTARVRLATLRQAKAEQAALALSLAQKLADNHPDRFALVPGLACDLASLKCLPLVLLRPGEEERLLAFLKERKFVLASLFPDSPACEQRRYIAVPLQAGTRAEELKELFACLQAYGRGET